MHSHGHEHATAARRPARALGRARAHCRLHGRGGRRGPARRLACSAGRCRPHALRRGVPRARAVRGLARRTAGDAPAELRLPAGGDPGRARERCRCSSSSRSGSSSRRSRRFSDPPEVDGGWVLVVGAIGLGVNLAAAGVLHRGAARASTSAARCCTCSPTCWGSVGVIVAGLVILTTGWELADPLVALLIGVAHARQRVAAAGESVGILLEATPRGMTAEDVGRAILGVPQRRRGARPPCLDDHVRLPGALGARARRAGCGLPRHPPADRGVLRERFDSRAHDASGRPRRACDVGDRGAQAVVAT